MKIEYYNNNENNEEESFSYLENDDRKLDPNIMNPFHLKNNEKDNNNYLSEIFKNNINMNKDLTDINDNELYYIKGNKSTIPDSSKVNFKNKEIEKFTQKKKQNELENKEPVILQEEIIIVKQKKNKRKTYEDKKEKRKSKQIFAVIEKDGFKKKKQIIRRNKNKKVGYATKIKSGRVDNIKDKIGRNIIQDIIPNWINYKEKDFNNILQKLKPSKIKDIDKLKNVPIEEIFKLDITLKGNIHKQHNISIIKYYNNNNVNNLKKIKFKFTLIDTIKAIIDKNIREKILSEKMPELKEKEEKERKELINEFFEGLKGIEEYLNEIDGSTCYKNKLKNVFLKFLNVDKL